MRKCWRRVLCAGSLLLGIAAQAQDNSLITVLRGDLLEWEAQEFSLRLADYRVERCRFDDRTYIERNNQRALSGSLAVGDWIEVVSDRNGGASNRCYARTVRQMARTEPRTVRSTPRPSSALPSYRSSVLDQMFPRGNLTYAGIVLRVSPEAFAVRTRNQGEKNLLLRQDTRYLSSGAPVEASQLRVNTKVFIRAGKNLDDELEAYQVVWGDILLP